MSFENALIADDHYIIHSALKMILSNFQSVKNVYEISDATTLFEIIEKKQIHLLFLDLNLPGLNPLEAIATIKKKFSECKIVVFTMIEDPMLIKKLLQAKIDGFLRKSESIESITEKVQKILEGQKVYPDDLEVTQDLSYPSPLGPVLKDLLTKREMEIYELVLMGLKNSEISKRLDLAKSTVERHRFNLRKKLNARNVQDLFKLSGGLDPKEL